MNMKIAALAATLLFALPSQAAVVCAGCEYDEGTAGSYLGLYDGLTRDLGTFTHTGIQVASAFEDFWIFDVTPNVVASISADFTVLAPLFAFFGELYRDAGSTCDAFTCTDIVLGNLLGRADAGGGSQFSIDDTLISFLTEGRYVLRIGGSPNSFNGGAYSGQLAAFGFSVNEPGTLLLAILGLLLLLVARPRHPRTDPPDPPRTILYIHTVPLRSTPRLTPRTPPDPPFSGSLRVRLAGIGPPRRHPTQDPPHRAALARSYSVSQGFDITR